MPSKSLPYGSTSSPCPSAAPAPPRRRCGGRRPVRRGAGRAASSAACRRAPPGRCPSAPRWRRWRRGPASCRLGPTARSRRRGATCRRRVRPCRVEVPGGAEPLAAVQAPCGELNEKARGDISGTLMPQTTQASLRENSRSPLSSALMTTTPSARSRAVCTDSDSGARCRSGRSGGRRRRRWRGSCAGSAPGRRRGPCTGRRCGPW